jgi:tRNA U34 5-methylaminomethyl-2-thiouridine-forming methyltransferase MnmC
MSTTEISTTKDGSHSLLNRELNETYHSVHGALQESVHVFIKNGFDFLAERSRSENISILEIGFGTGLNALLTLQRAHETKIPVQYTSLEAYPLAASIWQKLNYGESLGMTDDFARLHEAEWNAPAMIASHFRLHKRHTTLQQEELPSSVFDLIFYDAFAPGKQPEMWELPVLAKVATAMKPSAVFVTYCAKGQLKRDLKSLGLQVETLAGPPGKKEMVRAVKKAASFEVRATSS